MRYLIVIILAVVLVGCVNSNNTLQQRAEFWRAELARELPIGTSQEKVKEWGAARNIKFHYLEQQHVLQANVERIPDTGIICSEWNIILEIAINADGNTTNNKVSTVGACL